MNIARLVRNAVPALWVALPVSAAPASIVYEHPKAAAKLTVHYADKDANPDAAAYEGKKGMYLVTWRELYELGYDDAATQTRYNIYELTPAALEHREDHRAGASRWAYSGDTVIPALERVIAGLVKAKGKQEASPELASRIKDLRAKAKSAETRRKALEILEGAIPGSVKDAGRLKDLAEEIAAASAKIEEVESARAEVEPKLDTIIDPSNPNPKAAFYWGMGRSLDSAAKNLAQAENVLDWLPKK